MSVCECECECSAEGVSECVVAVPPVDLSAPHLDHREINCREINFPCRDSLYRETTDIYIDYIVMMLYTLYWMRRGSTRMSAESPV